MAGPPSASSVNAPTAWDRTAWLRERSNGADAFLASHAWQRDRLVGILAATATGAAAARAQELLDPRCVAVVTGQQLEVGGGPLYTVVKAAHAIAIARGLSEIGRPAAPIFWCASEDHDLGEADHADIIAADGSIHRFHGDLGGGRGSLRFRPARMWWSALIAHCRTHLGAGIGEPFIASLVPDADETMGAWHCRLLSSLFAHHGLICVEGHRLRPLWTQEMARAIDAWPAQELARVRAEALARGVADAFGDLSQPAIFADRPDGRTRLDRAAALALATADPTVLSPGAPLRPVLQQHALPASIYVAGPGERSYHEFIQPLYRTIGVPAPELVPRCSITLLPTRVRRILSRWGVAAAEVTATSTGPVIQTAADPCDRPSAELDAAIAAIAGAGAGRPEVEVTVRRLRRVAQAFQKRLLRSQRRAQGMPPFGTAVSWLWPRSQPQERVMSVFQALWEAGPGVADALVETAAGTAPGDVTSLSI